MAKGVRDCPYCSYVAASDAQLKHHTGRFHEALLALEGEQAREREKKIPGTGYDPRLHDIVQGYLHGDDRGKVYSCYVEPEEGCVFFWRCVRCNKVLKQWLEKWTPDSKERIRQEKLTGRSAYDPFKHFPAARAIVKRRP